ncbi:MAG: galactokinase [Dehalococcoidia bacterium]|nr:galactokinase [Dehalococcoidia bacterium]
MSEAPAARRDALIATFRRQFRRAPEGLCGAPGRVNLIGEHVDYNDGLVLPFAIDRSVLVAWAPRDDDAVWAYALDFDEHARFNLRHVTHAAPGHWSNYVRGVAAAMIADGHRPRGVDLALVGDVPAGAGLSSSAALEVATAGALREASALDLSPEHLALLCQRAENGFVGVQSGIMDQFASALSHQGAALLIDCRTLAHRDVPLALAAAGLAVVVTDSGVRRELVSTAYNERRRDCKRAVATLRERLARPELRALRDVATAELDVLSDAEGAPILRRARHVVSEIARVAAAVAALERDDFAALGRLMVESHLSLRDDYDVSTPELDLLVALATAQGFVLGSRLTGAGFGGCTVTLLEAPALERYERDVLMPYRERTSRAATMYVVAPQDGLRASTT